jgi:hypothetical protein
LSSFYAHYLLPRFVVLHGTDTLAYTSSALSFMLENLGKTVILTGSQIPCFETRSGEFVTFGRYQHLGYNSRYIRFNANSDLVF